MKQLILSIAFVLGACSFTIAKLESKPAEGSPSYSTPPKCESPVFVVYLPHIDILPK